MVQIKCKWRVKKRFKVHLIFELYLPRPYSCANMKINMNNEVNYAVLASRDLGSVDRMNWFGIVLDE